MAVGYEEGEFAGDGGEEFSNLLVLRRKEVGLGGRKRDGSPTKVEIIIK